LLSRKLLLRQKCGFGNKSATYHTSAGLSPPRLEGLEGSDAASEPSSVSQSLCENLGVLGSATRREGNFNRGGILTGEHVVNWS
jgi:hypothetical protein